MPLKALSMDKEIQYQSELDPDKGTDQATVFTIKALSARQVAKIRDKSTRFLTDGKEDSETNIIMELNSANYEFVRHGLKGWKNFMGVDGNPAEFKATKAGSEQKVTEDCMNMLTSDLIQELAQQITGFNSLDEDAVKN